MMPFCSAPTVANHCTQPGGRLASRAGSARPVQKLLQWSGIDATKGGPTTSSLANLSVTVGVISARGFTRQAERIARTVSPICLPGAIRSVPGAAYLAKPFTEQALTGAVRSALGVRLTWPHDHVRP